MVTSTLLKRTSTSNTPPKSSSSSSTTTSGTSPPTAQRPTKSRSPLKRSSPSSLPPVTSSTTTATTTTTTPLFNSINTAAQSSWIHSSPFSSSLISSTSPPPPSTSTLSSPSSLSSSLFSSLSSLSSLSSIPTKHVQSTSTSTTTTTSSTSTSSSTCTPSLNNKKNKNSKNHVRRKMDQKHLKKKKNKKMNENKVVVANTTTTVPNTTNSGNHHHPLNNNNNSSNKKKRKSSAMVNQYDDDDESEEEEEEDAEDTDDESDESDDDDDSDDEDYVVENNDCQQRTTTTDENDGASATLAKRKRKRKNHTAPVHAADTTATPLTTNTLNITPPPMIFCNKTFTTNTKSSVAVASSATNQKQQCVFIMYDPVEYKENTYERQELILNDHQLYQRLNEKQVQKIQQGQQQQQQQLLLFSSSSTTTSSSKNTKQQQEKHVATTSLIPLWALEISTSNINNVNNNNINNIHNNNSSSSSNGSNGSSGGDSQEIKSRSDLRGAIFDYVSNNQMKILDMYHVPTYMISHILFPMVHSPDMIDFHMTTTSSNSSSSSNTGTSNTSASGGSSSSVSKPPRKQKLTTNQSILLKILKENMELLFIHVPIASLLPQLLSTNHNNNTATTTDYHIHNEHDKMINLFEYACQYGTPVFFASLFTMIEKYCRQQIKQEKGTTTTHEKKKRKKNDYGKKLNSNTDSTVDDEHSHQENEEHLWLTYFKSKWDQAFKRDSESLMNCSMTQSYMHDLMSVVSVEFKQRDEWLKQVLSRSILTVQHVNPIPSSKSPSKSPSLSSSKSPSTELVFRKDLVQLDQHVISLIRSKDISVHLLDDYVKLGFNVNSMSQSDSIYLRDWAVNWAAESGSLEIVKRLVTHGAVITHDSSSISSLLANENLWNHQQMPITRTLKKHISLQKQQEQESHVKAHSTFLHAAVLGNNLDIVKYAVEECGFNVCDTTDADGDTALAYCCHNNKSREIAKYLMEKGASVNSVNNQGMTPMHLAAQEAHLNQVKFLVLHGASIDERAKNGKTPYHLAVEAKKPDIELIRFLITSGVNVYTRDNHNSPPEKDAKESVKQMIRNTHDQVNSIIAMTAKKCEVRQEILQSENDTLRKELNDMKERLKKLECVVSQLQESSTSSASMKMDDDEEEEEDGVIDLNL